MKFDGRFLYSYSSAISVSCDVMSGWSTLACLRWGVILRTFTRLFVQKLVSMCLINLHCCAIGCQNVYFSGCGKTFRALKVFLPGMTSSLAKCKQVFGRALLDVFTTIYLFVWSSSVCKWFDYIKERRQAIYFNRKNVAFNLWNLDWFLFSDLLTTLLNDIRNLKSVQMTSKRGKPSTSMYFYQLH